VLLKRPRGCEISPALKERWVIFTAKAHTKANPGACMQHINDLKIIGIDETRFPLIRKQPYIDLVFKLSHQAPADWCQDFNLLLSKHEYTTKIDAKAGLFIETWVRKMDEIEGFLEVLKKKITECNAAYIQKANDLVLERTRVSESGKNESGEQQALNRVIASLKFD
jgi:hypothetical protein